MLLLMDPLAPFAGVQSNKSQKTQRPNRWDGWYTFSVSASRYTEESSSILRREK